MNIVTELFTPQQHEHDRATRWLNDRIRTGKKSAFAEFGELTPELAALLLKINPNNRPLKEHHIERMARDISGGLWKTTGETIVISRCGLLNDGQNRCAAVIHAGRAISVNFVFGVEREARLYMDQGATRTPGDYLGMDGVKDPNNVAAAARKILDIKTCGKIITGLSGKPSKAEVQEFALLISAQLDRSIHVCRRKGHGKVASLSTLMTAHYLFSKVSPDDADDFIEKLIDGTGLSSTDPIFAVREKLIDPRKRLNQNEQLKAMFMGWNNYRKNKSVRSVTHAVKKGEKLPELV